MKDDPGFYVVFSAGNQSREVFVRSKTTDVEAIEARARPVLGTSTYLHPDNWTLERVQVEESEKVVYQRKERRADWRDL